MILTLLVALLCMAGPALSLEQPANEEDIARISRRILTEILGFPGLPRGQKTADSHSDLIDRIANEIARDTRPTQGHIGSGSDRVSEGMFFSRARMKKISMILLIVVGVGLAVLTPRIIRGLLGLGEKGGASGKPAPRDLVKTCADLAAVFVAVPSEAEAQGLGRALIEERLAAHAGITQSVRVLAPSPSEDTHEVLLMLQTRRSRAAKLRRRILEGHSLPNPEIIIYPVWKGYAPHVEGIRRSTRRLWR